MAPSFIWNYCSKTNHGNKIKCNICEKEFLFNKSTSTMMKHLQSLHKIDAPPNKNTLSRKRVNDNEDDNSVIPPKKALVAIESSASSSSVCLQNKSTSALQSASSLKFDSHQGPLNRCINNATSFAAGGWKHNQVTTALLQMIAIDNMPLSTPERAGFKMFVKKIQPLYRLPCEPTLTAAMTLKYEELSNKVKIELQQAESVCLTTDIWTHHHTMKSYLGLTAHYLKGVEMKTVELGAYHMEERKTIENLRSKLRKICNDWGLNDDKISTFVSDGGANIKGAIKSEFGSEKHISCIGHVINNIGQRLIEINITPSASESGNKVDDLPLNEEDIIDDSEILESDKTTQQTMLRDLLTKVKKIVTFFRHSERATTELLSLQSNLPESKRLKLIQEVKTRWNSCFEMINRFIVLADHVGKVLLQVKMDKSSKAKPPNMITGDELESLIEVRDILSPLWRVTQEVCAEKNVTLSKCIPLIASLRKKTENFKPDTLIGRQLQKKITQEIETKYGNIESVKLYACATLLDPRYKKCAFYSIRESARAITNVGDLVRIERNVASQATGSSAILDDDEVTTAIEAQVSSNDGNDDDDIWSYLDEAVNYSHSQADTDEAGGLPIQLRQ
ncbi:zinc finger BED domain-containing protein 4-like [Cotesia glomerata]|uniref:zinc finger BED domain-containing protein 4-like n=1 Tax=Cotesia glomerata TaxID=32391 RepID=UPI001D02290E|nr:zinc finger BED domain-containing protein 4-like [Cotesia glomerata]